MYDKSINFLFCELLNYVIVRGWNDADDCVTGNAKATGGGLICFPSGYR